uniref:Uncharacterized protein n=1 Tax=Athene cunicularia TaxID=194338 RepID=A0A663MUA7_ATHCN
NITGQRIKQQQKSCFTLPLLLSPLLTGFCIKMFYSKPLKYSGLVKKGERIGVMLPMQRLYQGIISHVHIQNWDLTDPTSNL